MSSVEITIRSIQHYLYCPHRWGLLEIDKAWAEYKEVDSKLIEVGATTDNAKS